MDRSRFRNIVVSMASGGELAATLRQQDITVYDLGLSDAAAAPHATVRLCRLLRRCQPEVLQTWLYLADLLGTIAAQLTRVPVLSWNVRHSVFHPDHAGRATGVAFKLLRHLSARPDAVVVNSSRALKAHVAAGYCPRRCKVIPNGFDTSSFRPDTAARRAVRSEFRIPDDALVVGYVGRHNPDKDIPTFFTAAAKLAHKETGVQFMVVGSGLSHENPEITELTRKMPRDGCVRLLGQRTDIARLMTAFDALALSSVTESFPNVVGEAMACGVPCVVTDCGDAAAIVGDTGFVVPVRDPGALAEALLSITRMSPLARKELGMSARQRIESMFSLDAVARQYENLYEELVADVRHRRLH